MVSKINTDFVYPLTLYNSAHELNKLNYLGLDAMQVCCPYIHDSMDGCSAQHESSKVSDKIHI